MSKLKVNYYCSKKKRLSYIDEAERSRNNAIIIVRSFIYDQSVVVDGSAIEMEVSHYLREYFCTIESK